MQKILMIGVILLGMLSCVSIPSIKPPTVKLPIEMFAINTKFKEAGMGAKNLNILSNKTSIKYIPL